jgi:hypothetical protein
LPLVGAAAAGAATVTNNLWYGRAWDEGLWESLVEGFVVGAIFAVAIGAALLIAGAGAAASTIALYSLIAVEIATVITTVAVNAYHGERLTKGLLANMALAWLTDRIFSKGRAGRSPRPSERPPAEPGGEPTPARPRDPGSEPQPGGRPAEPGTEPPVYDPKTKQPGELARDADPAPRPGETPEQAQERAKAAQEEASARGFCFVAGTLVQTPHGAVPIETLEPGHSVLAQPEGQAVASRFVLDTNHGWTRSLLHIEVAGGALALSATPTHPMFVVGKGWTGADQLVVGDELVTIDGTGALVTAVRHERLSTAVATFNLHVEEAHSYFVGDDLSVLVHNGDPNDPRLSGRVYWGLGASGPRQRLPRDADPENANPKLREAHPGDPDGASAWVTDTPEEVGRFMGARVTETAKTTNHGGLTQAQIDGAGLVAVETPGHGAPANAGIKHVSIRPASNPDPEVPLTNEEMADVKAKLESLKPEVKNRPADFGCG